MALIGLLLTVIGVGLMYFARQTEGISGAVLFVLALLLCGFGIYLVFFEQGQGAGRWLVLRIGPRAGVTGLEAV